ncbi:MAG: CBM9 family sugar-binding protein [Bacteroidota bacterium]
MHNKLIVLVAIAIFMAATTNSLAQKKNNIKREVTKVSEPLTIDGSANEEAWNKAKWMPLDQRWLGDKYSSEDFSGRYKLLWSEDALHLYVEVTDDILFDQYDDPLKLWWDDDCVEVFIDEDNSGGEHQYNHNAFAYHIALDYNVVDLGPDNNPHLYNDHFEVKRTLKNNLSTWEMSIKIFDDSFKDGGQNTAVKLTRNKNIGFALAYCDNDQSVERENFIGSEPVEGEDKNRGWIDAGIFGTLVLVDR